MRNIQMESVGPQRQSKMVIVFLLLCVLGSIASGQPVDICNEPNGVLLIAGGIDQLDIKVPSGAKLVVEIVQDCDEDPILPPANNSVHCSGGGGNYQPSDVQWMTYTAQDRQGLLPQAQAARISISADDEFTISLDACLGTVVRIYCQ